MTRLNIRIIRITTPVPSAGVWVYTDIWEAVMSSRDFSFPPPPPPPPPQPRSVDASSISRGRGRSGTFAHGGGGSHQRGSFPSAGSYRGRGRGNHSSSTNHGPYRHNLNTPTKRDHDKAFMSGARSRPHAPAAVPSFNAGLENLLPPKTSSVPAHKFSSNPRKTNILGLTPVSGADSDSEEDVDEESKLSNINAGDLQIEYRGLVSTLRTSAEIAAWIAERRKRWPTQAKREAARKEAEEKKRQWEDEKRKRAEIHMEGKRKPIQGTKKARREHGTRKAAPASKDVQSQTEELRRKARKAQSDLQAAEDELHRLDGTQSPTDANNQAPPDHADSDMSSILSDSSLLTESDATSSTGSEPEDEALPDKMSSRTEVAPLRHPSTRNAKPCKFFAQYGKCKFGNKCKYGHDRQEHVQRSSGGTEKGSKVKRKGLWQVMVEKEEQEERKKVLQAIISLGKQGILDHAA